MTVQQNSLELIRAFGYNARQVAEVLGISTRVASLKMNGDGYNKFTPQQFSALLSHFAEKTRLQNEILSRHIS